MANKQLFNMIRKQLGIQPANTKNHAGGPAYTLSTREALARLAVGSCLTNTFYSQATEQLEQATALAEKVDPKFLAQLAVYSRKVGLMKDMPALLLAILSRRDGALFEKVFPLVVDDAKMLKNFVQIMRSGAAGRKSLGSRPKRLVKAWLAARTTDALFAASVGRDPSLSDVIRLAHPRPLGEGHRELFGHLLGAKVEAAKLPEIVRKYQEFKDGETLTVPKVPFQLLTSLPLSTGDWKQIALNGSWQMVRMNLNTFQRHGVLDDVEVAAALAAKLADRESIGRAKAFPYQLLAAHASTLDTVPACISEALEKAMEHALRNVPKITGKIYIAVDVSGSMSSPITGYRKGATSMVSCVSVASLIASAILRKNPEAEVLPFHFEVCDLTLDPKAKVLENAARLQSVGGGGTTCSAPLARLNGMRAKGDLVIYVSDNESWMDQTGKGRGTAMMAEWKWFKQRNAAAKLVCIDLTPNTTVQAATEKDILNIGGFSDRVFELIRSFANGELTVESHAADVEQMVI